MFNWMPAEWCKYCCSIGFVFGSHPYIHAANVWQNPCLRPNISAIFLLCANWWFIFIWHYLNKPCQYWTWLKCFCIGQSYNIYVTSMINIVCLPLNYWSIAINLNYLCCDMLENDDICIFPWIFNVSSESSINHIANDWRRLT